MSDSPAEIRRTLLRRVMDEGPQPVEAQFAFQMFRDCLIHNWCAATGLSFRLIQNEFGCGVDFIEFYIPQPPEDNGI